jgi:hypothetical protein
MTRSRKGAELHGAYDAGSLMFRNRIINGNGMIAQRGTSFSSLPIASGTNNTYTLDRFALAVANSGDSGAITVSQVSGGLGQRYVTATANASPSSIASTSIRQIIEGLNCFDLAGQQATVSFKVKTNKAGNYGLFIYDYTGSSYGTPQYITCAGTGAVETFTKTFTMPSSITADNAARLGLNITLVAGSGRAGTWYPSGVSQVNFVDSTSNYFELYEVQLEKGSVATPFEVRPYGTELALCQRYYQTSLNGMQNYASFHYGPNAYCGALLPVTMRSAPAVATTGSSTTYYESGATFTASNFAYVGVNAQYISMLCAVSGGNQGGAGTWYPAFQATAEL